MPRKQKSIHYLYKTTCNVTGRWYIGIHSTNNLDDGYLGSGIRLRRSIRKYGESNHTKEILEFFDTRELLIEAEKTVITDDMVGDPSCMNLMSGGTGGFISVEQQKHRSECGGKAHAERLKNDVGYRERHNGTFSKNREKWIKSGKHNFKTFEGKMHSDETKRKMSESSKGQGTGSSNSQYGSCWITNEIENKKIMKGDSIPDGWRLGRKIKN